MNLHIQHKMPPCLCWLDEWCLLVQIHHLETFLFIKQTLSWQRRMSFRSCLRDAHYYYFLKIEINNVTDSSSGFSLIVHCALRSWRHHSYWVRKWCRGSRFLFCVQDGALDLLRELKNIKMSLETLQVFTSTPLPHHSHHPTSDTAWWRRVITAGTSISLTTSDATAKSVSAFTFS